MIDEISADDSIYSDTFRKKRLDNLYVQYFDSCARLAGDEVRGWIENGIVSINTFDNVP